MHPDVVCRLISEYGSPLYVFDEVEFEKNYRRFERIFQDRYENYRISYSFKTNYTPYIAKKINELGGYAEVVSGMEYYIAKRVGYSDDRIIFNGPNKKEAGRQAFLNGCIVNVDSIGELKELCCLVKKQPTRIFEIGIRVNLDVGQSFISRFGIDPCDLEYAFCEVEAIDNLRIVGLHCHISRCRGIDAWRRRAQFMLELADKYFSCSPRYLDFGSGMFGDMSPEFAEQFSNVPTYDEYACATAELVADHYRNETDKPLLFTEPGTTLINRYVSFIATIDYIKKIRGEYFAILDCSEHNLGETCMLKDLPVKVYQNGKNAAFYPAIHLSGYTCLEQDIMRKNVCCQMAIGDYVLFENVGGYSNVLKPPFIWPNCRMIAYHSENHQITIIKENETYEDILSTYVF